MTKRKPRKLLRTRTMIDQERYTLAMFLIGYCVSTIHSLMKEPGINGPGRYQKDFEWIKSRVAMLMNLNEERGIDDAPKDAAPGPKSDN